MLDKRLLLVPIIGWLTACNAPAIQRLLPAQPESFIVTADEPAVLKWRVETREGTAPIHGTVTDYAGRTVTNFSLAPASDGTFQATVTLAQGYYEFTFPSAMVTFGALALPGPQGPADPFFCIDAALSWLQTDPARRLTLAKMLARCRVTMARERFHWGVVNSGPGQFTWQTDRRYQELRETYEKNGLKILELFHDAPGWTGATKSNVYPADLIGTARAWEQIGRQWGRYWSGIEIWNEPDIFFGGSLPADQYVATVKAVAHGLATAQVEAPVGGGVFTGQEGDAFLHACGKGRLLDAVDFISFHSYDSAMAIEPQVVRYRKWLKQWNHESLPLWITECGWPWRRGSDEPPADQDAASALEIVAKAVEARACGVARHFPFVLPFYEEGDKNFAMTRKDGTPLRSFAAYAWCVAALSGTAYVGDLQAADAGIRRARVFANQDRAVVVFYTGATNAPPLRPDLAGARFAGIDGRFLQPDSGGAIPLRDGLIYAFVGRAALGGRLLTNTPAARLYAVAQHPRPTRSPPSPVFIQHVPDLARLHATSLAYEVPLQAGGKFPLHLRVNNLASDQREAIVILTPDKETSQSSGNCHRQAIRLDPMKTQDINWTVDLANFGSGPVKWLLVKVLKPPATVLDSLLIPVKAELSLPDLLKSYSRVRRIPIDELAAWQKSAVADARTELSAKADGHWSMEARFGQADPWAYPVFKLPSGLSLRHATALIIRAKCAQPAVVRIILREENQSTYFTAAAIIPADGQWHAAAAPLGDFTPLPAGGPPDANGRLDRDQIEAVMIGFNSQSRDNSLDVSDLYIAED